MYDLEEQEQIDELKAWWKQYGRMLIVLVVAACVGAAGTAGWQWYKRSQSEQASQLYGALEKAVRANDLKQIRELSGQLMDKFAGTAYGPMAALAAAKASYDGGDAKSAQAQLQWTIDNARDDDLIATARLRLAGVLLAVFRVAQEALSNAVTHGAPPVGPAAFLRTPQTRQPLSVVRRIPIFPTAAASLPHLLHFVYF
jgi:predicted negative regulator of RcsB-dependent stress response